MRSCNRGNAQLPSTSGIQAMVLYPCPKVIGFEPDKGYRLMFVGTLLKSEILETVIIPQMISPPL